MSTVFVCGNFGIVGGRRSLDGPQYYAFYQTTMQFASSDKLSDVEIRVYTPRTATLFRDCTVVNVIGRLFAPSEGTFLIDVLNIVPFPGNPEDDEDYESSIVDDTSVKIWAIGTVIDNAEQWTDGSSRIFSVAVSDYVRDKIRHFQISCLLDGTSGRWTKTPNPNINTTIYVYGVLNDVSCNGNLILNLQSITLNIGREMVPTGAAQGVRGGSKKRKYPVALTIGTSVDTLNMLGSSKTIKLPETPVASTSKSTVQAELAD
ncbi:hypothetical protein K439DRAFT_1406623 [Ramaria rubella]|nr:hypothetical protein K439DRAFT_1406623 [Ramaria rubella]